MAHAAGYALCGHFATSRDAHGWCDGHLSAAAKIASSRPPFDFNSSTPGQSNRKSVAEFRSTALQFAGSSVLVIAHSLYNCIMIRPDFTLLSQSNVMALPESTADAYAVATGAASTSTGRTGA